MVEWQLQAFLALVTLSMMAPCLFTATTARKVQMPGRKWAGLEHLPPHVDLMVAVVHCLKICTYLLVMASHTTYIHSTIKSHVVFM